MRLLDTKTGEFVWVEDPRKIRYAILSHVWAHKGDPNYVPEQTYQDVRRMQESAGQNERVLPLLSEKIRMFCEVAHNDGFELGWIDTCCIDKTSSSELSEAINSMYNWYRYAGACYAFLHDVSDTAQVQERMEQFRSSKWFTRGWTLQELLAPSVVLFLSDKWKVIGSKHTLARLVESVTGIERKVLTLKLLLEDVSVARRMSWAASRETMREEDEAYSLMGIFGVNMPTTYGEGRYAFIRLQEEILKHIPDQTIFAWGPILSRHAFSFSHPSNSTLASPSEASPIPIAPSSKQFLLASSPKDFKSSSHMIHIPRDAFAERLGISPDDAFQVYTTTSYGIHARFPLVAVVSQDSQSNFPTHLALLACEDDQGRLLALLLRPQVHMSGTEYFIGTIVGRVRDLMGSDEPYSTISTLWSHYYRTTYLTLQQVDYCLRRGFFETTTVYIPHRPSPTATGLERDTPLHAALREARDAFEVRLSGWSRKLLMLQGYRVSPGLDTDVAIRDRVLSRTLSSSASGIVIANSHEYIVIQVGRCNCEFGGRFGLLGVLVSSRTATSPLEDQFAEEPHFINHPVHIHSWSFRCGVASKEVTLDQHTGEGLVLRLTFTHEERDAPNTKAYRLGVEIWSAETVTDQADRDAWLAPSGWRNNIERSFPTRKTTRQLPDRAATYTYLAPERPVPPLGLQRTRSNSDPSLFQWAEEDEPHQDGRQEDLHLQVPQHQAPSHQSRQTPPTLMMPSPPISSESDQRGDLPRGGNASGALPRDPPHRGYSRDLDALFAEGASRHEAHQVKAQGRGAPQVTRRATAWALEGQAIQSRLNDHRPPPPRSISMESGLDTPSSTPDRDFGPSTWEEYSRSPRPRQDQPPERRASEDESRYVATRRRGQDTVRRPSTAAGRGASTWVEGEGGNVLRNPYDIRRTNSPDPMTSGEELDETGVPRRKGPGSSHKHGTRARSPVRQAESGAPSARAASLSRERPRAANHQNSRSDVPAASASDKLQTPHRYPDVPAVRIQKPQRDVSLSPDSVGTPPRAASQQKRLQLALAGAPPDLTETPPSVTIGSSPEHVAPSIRPPAHVRVSPPPRKVASANLQNQSEAKVNAKPAGSLSPGVASPSTPDTSPTKVEPSSPGTPVSPVSPASFRDKTQTNSSSVTTKMKNWWSRRFSGT